MHPEEIERLGRYFDERRDEMLAAVRELVVRETPSHDKARLDAFAARKEGQPHR